MKFRSPFRLFHRILRIIAWYQFGKSFLAAMQTQQKKGKRRKA